VAGGKRGRRDTPAQDEGRHQDAVRHLDDQETGEGLPRQLRDGRDRAEERVLAAGQTRRLDQAEGRRVAQHGLVENLEEVHPYENDEDGLVGLPLDALVLFVEGFCQPAIIFV